ncbi:MAG TPA: dihydrodipicolinate synthase family protein [Trebonia sp.]|nr:dihydrodipicolinate synthase family protein [Trebonia sp.]
MDLTGIWVALLTPLTDEGRVDLDALARHAADLAAEGVQGLVPLGTTGEFCELSRDERSRIIGATTAAVAGRIPVLAGVTGISTTDTQRYADDAALAGASGLLALPPLYWKPDEQGLYAHFRSVAGTTGLPLVLYSYPALTASVLGPGLIRRLALEDERIAGVKLTVRDASEIAAVAEAVKHARPGFRIVTGFEDLLPATMWSGGDGAVSGMANFCAGLLLRLHAALRDGDPAAAGHYRRLMELFGVYRLSSPPILGLKAAAEASGRPVRALTRVYSGQREEVLARAKEWAVARLADGSGR